VPRNRREFIEVLAGTLLVPAALSARAWARPGSVVSAPPPSAGALFDVTRYDAACDGRTLATAGLQRAIDACGAAGGGTVLVPAGRYLTGALFLRSHVNFHLSSGATLLASQDPKGYPAVKGREEGLERTVHASVLTGVDLENVTISGRGTIDGQGDWWWDADESIRKARVAAKLPREAENPAGSPLQWPRPRSINLIRCREGIVSGIVIKDSPSANVHLVYCTDVLVEGITTFQKRIARSTEGVMVDSSKRVRIRDCSLSAGADCVSIKSGYNEDGRRVGLPTEDVAITGCHMFRTGGSGLAIGSEVAGGVRDVVMSDCVIQDTMEGLHFRAPRGRGGVVENIRVANVVLENIAKVAVQLTNFWDSIRMDGPFGFKITQVRGNPETARSRLLPVNEGTPTFRNFSFSGLTVGKAAGLAVIEGLPERYMTGVSLQDITFVHGTAGIFCSLAADVSIGNLSVNTLDTPAVDAREVQRLEIHRLRCSRPKRDVPLVWMDNVSDAFVHGCDVGNPGPGYSWVRQEQSTNVLLSDNRTPPAGDGPTK
jgi:polygalacturonase